MPGCPPSCPKVKRELKRLAAERKKALERGAEPTGKDEEEKAPEHRIPSQQISLEDLDISKSSKYYTDYLLDGKKQLESIYDAYDKDVRVISSESDHDSEGYRPKGKLSGKFSFREETSPRGSHSAESQQKPHNRTKSTDEDFDQVETASRDARSAKNQRKTEDGIERADEDSDEIEITSRGSRSAGSRRRHQEGSRSSEKDLDEPETSSRRSDKGQDKGSKKKIRNRSLDSEGSDFGGSDGESRSPGKSGRGRGPDERDFKKLARNGRRGDSGGYESDRSGDYDPQEYISDQGEGFDSSKHKPCSSECSLQRLKEEMMRRKLDAKQKAVDDYLLNKGMNYFEDLCTCSSVCLAKQLWHDPFVRKMIVSAALFAVGIKLCYEMDAWYIPT